jgi:hypothetical protein
MNSKRSHSMALVRRSIIQQRPGCGVLGCPHHQRDALGLRASCWRCLPMKCAQSVLVLRSVTLVNRLPTNGSQTYMVHTRQALVFVYAGEKRLAGQGCSGVWPDRLWSPSVHHQRAGHRACGKVGQWNFPPQVSNKSSVPNPAAR